METVGTFDAKNRLSALLDKVEAGEEVLITRNGKPVAKLVGAKDAGKNSQAVLAAKRIRARRIGRTLAGQTLEDLVNEGRR